MNKRIELIIKIFIGATFFLPLVLISKSFIFPFIVPKILLFRSLVLLMLGGYVILLASNWQKYKISFSPSNIAAGVFFVSFAVSTFVGVDWYKSFWDNHERMLGLFTIFHYIIYYYVITSVIKEWRDWKWLLRVFLLAGMIVMFIGFWQRFVDAEFLLNKFNLRVSATLGNPIYFSGYGLFLFFVGCLLAIKEKKIWWKVFAVVGGVLGFWGIFGGGTRGTFLGLAAGLAAILLVYSVFLKGNKKLKHILFGVIGVGIVCLGLLISFRTTNFVKSIPMVGKVLNIDIKEGTALTRSMAWGIAVDAWKEKPVFGWGPNNYYYAFNKYYRAEFLELGWGETWFDNAHSAMMNTLAVQGIIGILSYMGLFAVPFYALWRGYKREIIGIYVFSVSSAFLVAHFVHNAFVFENPTSYLYFFFFLAFINSRTEDKGQESEKENKNFSVPLSVSVIFVTLLLVYSTNINPARANKATLDTIIQVRSGGDAVSAYERANKIPSPHIDDIRNDFARSAIEVISYLEKAGKKKMSQDFYDLVYGELEKNRKLHPLDIRVNISQAQLTLLAGRINDDVKYLIKSEEILEDALVKSPKRQQLQYMLANVKFQLGKAQEAVALLEDSIKNNEKIAESWWRLAVVYDQIGNNKKAQEIILEAQEKGVKFSEHGDSEIRQIFPEAFTE